MRKIGTIKNMTPGRAIRAFCVKCVGGALGDVKNCGGEGKNALFDVCSLFPYRMGRGRPSVKIIRKFCLKCMGGIPSLVRECTSNNCNCYSYRMGKNPARAGMGIKDLDRMRLVHLKKDYVSRQKSVYFR